MKKIYISLFAFLFCFNLSALAQPNCVHVTDQVLLQQLTGLYPACFAGHPGFMDTTCNDIVTATSLSITGGGISATNIQDMSPIVYFDSLKYLDCSYNSLSTIYCPSHLETLICTNQAAWWLLNYRCLHGLPGLPATLRVLDCSFNAIGGLPALPAGLTSLKCDWNANYFESSCGHVPALTSLPALPASLQYLSCSSNGITSLPALPPGLRYLNVANNKYHSFSSCPNPIADIPGISQLPTLPASLLELNVSNNSIGEMPALPASLAFLDVSENPISCLPELPASMAGQSPYNTLSYNLKSWNTNIVCLLNNVPGIRDYNSLPVCNPSNNINGCGSTTPFIGITPTAVTGLNAVMGSPSNSVFYYLFGHNLPASGVITLTPSAFIGVSTDNINFSSSPITIPFTDNHLALTPFYTRINSGAPIGAFSGTITHSGGSALDAILTVNGTIHPTPVLTVTPSPISITTYIGGVSNPEMYTLSGHDLYPASGTITISASSTLMKLSLDNINFTASSISLPYTGGQINNVPVYMQFSSSQPNPTLYNLTITNSGGNAAPAEVPVTVNLISQGPPEITAGPDINGLLITGTGQPSNAGSYYLSAIGLLPISDNITISSSSAFLELSVDNGNTFTSGPVSIPYQVGYVSNKRIYARISMNAPVGNFSATITNSGGGVIQTVAVTGNVYHPNISTSVNSINGLITTVGNVSNSGSYLLSATDLYPTTGSITISHPDYIELSTDNTSFSSAAMIIPYTNSQLNAIPIYARIASNAAAGTISASITNSVANASDAIVNFSGTVYNPVINAGPVINGLFTLPGNPSQSGTFNLSAQQLVPFAGNISITPGNFLEVSTDNINFSASSLNVAYSNGQLGNSSIYVRLSSNAPSGIVTGTVTVSGGSATDAIVDVNGTVLRPTLFSGLEVNDLLTTKGIASPAKTYDISAQELFPLSGEITITAPDYIELSKDNINFSHTPLSVSYTGGQLASMPVYVRLSKEAPLGDITGTIINSGGSAPDKTVLVKGKVGSSSVLLIPNPARNQVTVSLPITTVPAIIYIYNATGSLVKQVSTSEALTLINISDLSKGTYLIKVTGKDKTEMQRLIVE